MNNTEHWGAQRKRAGKPTGSLFKTELRCYGTPVRRQRKILHSVFRDRKVENQWLREPQSLLDGSSPRDLLLEGSWPNLLRVRQFTEMMAGL
ncbi:MAG: hypothetical protein USCGTAYLOR_00015 [Chromatiales bacterium USCg_Taylor]|nr:MAG: hypothetical protein USCGTAYLOR_00015 [Chromatiales bacterium USCg_Taylor]